MSFLLKEKMIEFIFVITKDEAKNLFKNADLGGKSGTL